MAKENTNNNQSNILTVNGVIYKTSGNITFSESDSEQFCLAHSSVLDEMNSVVENGMQTLLKKG